MAAASDPGEDDEALRWFGDEERGQAPPRRPVRERAPGPGARAATLDAASSSGAEVAEDAGEPLVRGERGRRVAAAAFALPFLAEIVGWVLGTARLTSGTTVLWTEILWQFGEFLAIVSPVLWFVATLSLTTASRPLVRAGWLALGLGVLLPWPALLPLLPGAS